jgi:type IV secretion system protein VirB8
VGRSEARYFEEAVRWDADREEALRANARRAWIVAAVAAGLALIAVTAVPLLLPLKRTEPYVIRVDSSTGVADVVPGYVGTADLPDTVLRHLVTEYVTLRERYIPALAESDYEQVGAYQSAPLNEAWAAAWTKANPESPLNRYADDARVTVQVQSVTFLRQGKPGPDIVQVRIRRGTLRNAGGDEQVEHFVATMTTRFTRPSDDLRLRSLNPLGFSVLDYRREPELPDAPLPDSTARAERGGT